MEELKDIIEASGELEVKARPKYNLPLVRFHGKEGRFLKYVFDEEGNKQAIDLGDKIQGVMLKVRRVFVGWGQDYWLFTNEHNSWKDQVYLFEGKKTERGIEVKMIDKGLCGELKSKYPELKMRQVIYFLLEPTKEVVKLQIKGKGLSYLFDYWAGFKHDEQKRLKK